MSNQRKLFSNIEQRNSLLKSLYIDYVEKNMTITQISDEYGYSKRQIRYIIDRYLQVKKGSGNHHVPVVKVEEQIVEKEKDESNYTVDDYLDNGYIITSDGKMAKRTSVEDLLELAKKRIKNTNKKVENN
jgi:hypothetical protein